MFEEEKNCIFAKLKWHKKPSLSWIFMKRIYILYTVQYIIYCLQSVHWPHGRGQKTALKKIVWPANGIRHFGKLHGNFFREVRFITISKTGHMCLLTGPAVSVVYTSILYTVLLCPISSPDKIACCHVAQRPEWTISKCHRTKRFNKPPKYSMSQGTGNVVGLNCVSGPRPKVCVWAEEAYTEVRGVPPPSPLSAGHSVHQTTSASEHQWSAPIHFSLHPLCPSFVTLFISLSLHFSYLCPLPPS